MIQENENDDESSYTGKKSPYNQFPKDSLGSCTSS